MAALSLFILLAEKNYTVGSTCFVVFFILFHFMRVALLVIILYAVSSEVADFNVFRFRPPTLTCSPLLTERWCARTSTSG